MVLNPNPGGSGVDRLTIALTLVFLVPACGGTSPAPPGVTLAITGVSVVPMDGRGILRDHTVLIRDAEILEVTRGQVRLPEGVPVLDGEGAYVIPGLWDLHVHAVADAGAFFPLFLAHGVTGVRDMGGEPDSLAAVVARLASGELLGPRLVAAGPILDGPGHRWSPPFVRHLETEEEARAAVAELARTGVDFLKVYSGLPPEVYRALAGEAAERGLPLAGHVPFAVPASLASGLGQASFEHADPGTAGLECVDDGEARLRSALGVWGGSGYGPYLGELAALREGRDAACVRDLHRVLRENGTRVVPTLGNHVKDSAHVSWEALPLLDEPRRRSCLATLELFHQAGDEERKGHHAAVLADVGALHRAGVRVLAGTDTPNPCLVPGASLHDELALLVQAGLTPREALAAATVEAARFLGLADRLGTVEAGKTADLVLVRGNPVDDIGAVRNVVGVVFGGRLLHPGPSSP